HNSTRSDIRRSHSSTLFPYTTLFRSMVAEGSFREDLFYRLNVLNLEVPPLRERGQDILLLAQHFMAQACAQIQRLPCRLAPTTLDRKSTRLNSSHVKISYAVFCLKKK